MQAKEMTGQRPPGENTAHSEHESHLPRGHLSVAMLTMEHFALSVKHSLKLFGGTSTQAKCALSLGTFSSANIRHKDCHNALPCDSIHHG